jgi:Mn2+/Fe2+ NRAMP family transporter
VKGESRGDGASVPTLGWRGVALVVGPGLVVMLADTDAGSVITAAQSGAQRGYELLPLQFLIIPVLFMVQELTVRLGLGTGKGYGELILQRFGRAWALPWIVTLAVSCFGALVTEMSGLAGVGQLFGVPAWQTITISVVLIFLMVSTGSYRSVERAALFLGMFELAFLAVAWKASPSGGELLAQVAHAPLGDTGYLYLLAANLGTSVMPWTVFYQQSAMIDKGLASGDMKIARLETLSGAIICQLITAAVLIAAAATLGRQGSGASLDNVPLGARLHGRTRGLRGGAERRRSRRRHRGMPVRGLGGGRGDGISPFPRASPDRRALVLRGLRGDPGGERLAGGLGHQSRPLLDRRRRPQRALPADRPCLPL